MNGRRPPGAAGWHRGDATSEPPVTLVEDQERPVAWMGRVGGSDPDPRHVDDVWDPVAAAWVPRPSAGCALVTGLALGTISGFILGLLIAWVIAAAASRPAATAIPADTPWSGTHRSSSSGNLSQPTTAPQPTPRPIDPGATVGPDAVDSVTRSGTIAWAHEGLGPTYVAIPTGAGHRVTICGPGGCWTTASTDAGPDLRMQREGRIADVAVDQWERICGVPRRFGVCEGSWEVVEP
jgi:hypothetical protein